MTSIIAGGLCFHIEFRHERAIPWYLGGGTSPTIPWFISAHVVAITTCVIVAVESTGEPKFTAIGTAICARGDNFSRHVGRVKAFRNAVLGCGALRGCQMALLAAYMERDPDPLPSRPTPRAKLCKEEQLERWQAGWEKRKARELEHTKQAAREGLRQAIEGEAAEQSRGRQGVA